MSHDADSFEQAKKSGSRARKPPRLNIAASICKAVAKYDLNAHITFRPDGVVEFDITGKKDAAAPATIDGIRSDVAEAIEAL
jgi:hypothetical protein